MRTGVRIGVDVGKARIGVARCDLHGMLATPVETVSRDQSGERDVRAILDHARELAAIEIIVGLPLGLSGQSTPSTEDAEHFAARISEALCTVGEWARDIAVRMVDERLSTVSAQVQLRQAGKRTKQSREIIDQAAAVIILQHALDVERSRKEPPGTVVVPVAPVADGGEDSDRLRTHRE